MNRRQIVRTLGHFRNGLLYLTGIAVIGLVFLRIIDLQYHVSSDVGFTLVKIFVALILSTFLAQVLVVILIGKAKSRDTDEATWIAAGLDPRQLSDAAFDDWLGPNAFGRLLKWVAFFVLLFIYCDFRFQAFSPPWYFYLIAVLIVAWSTMYSIARITFHKEGIQFGSACHCTWGFGRHLFLAYDQLTIRQPKFWIGGATILYHNGQRIYFINKRQWLEPTYFEIIQQLTMRLTPSQCALFVRRKYQYEAE